MWNVWHTLHEDQVKATISHARSQRYSTENEDVRKEKIEMDESWREEL